MAIMTSGVVRITDDGQLTNMILSPGFTQYLHNAYSAQNTVWAGEHLRAIQGNCGSKAGEGEISVAYIPITQNGTLRFSIHAWSNTNDGGYVRLHRWRDGGGTLVYAPGYTQTSGITFVTDQVVEYGDRFIWNISGRFLSTCSAMNAAVYTDGGSRFDASAFLCENRADKFAYKG